MGMDKALVEFRGQPLIVHALQILRGAALSAAIAGGQPGLAGYAPVVPDLEPDLGPLAGVCAAIASTNARWAVFMPVDLPLLPASLVQFLHNRARATGHAITLASVAGFAQTFPAVIARATLPSLQAELTAGHRGCFSAFKASVASLEQTIDVIAAELIAHSGHVSHPEGLSPANWFLNINSADDLRLAEAQGKTALADPDFIA